MSIIIAPSILSADFLKLGEEISACERGGTDWIHVDVMDGSFVPNITMGIPVVEACRRATSLPLDVHLMIEYPERHLEAFVKAGADILTVHVETCPHIYRTLQFIKSLGCKAGITLNPGTPVSTLTPSLELADLVLIMSVNPGFSGQAYIPQSVERVAEVRGMLNAIQSKAHLQVDGGVSEKTLGALHQAGADTFVAGHGIFKHPQGIAAAIQVLRSAAQG
jgi:ribulose-phosphate 3-epimerase